MIHTVPLGSYYNEVAAFLLALLVILSFLWRFDRHVQVPHIVIWLSFFCLFLVYQLRTLPEWQNIGLPFCYLLVAMALICIFRHYRLFYTVAFGLVAAGAFNVYVLIHQALTHGMSIGAVYQANHTGDYLTLAALSVVYLLMKRQLHLLFALFLLFGLAIGMLLTHSRSVIIYLAIIVLISIQARRAVVLVSLLSLVCAFYLAFKPNDDIRIILWHYAVTQFLSSPITGTGFGTYLATYDMTQWANHSHNILLQLLAETGLVGTGLLLLGFLGWLYDFVDSKVSLEKWYVACVLSTLTIHSLLEFPLWYSYFLFPFAIFLGLGTNTLVTPIWLGRTRRRILFIIFLCGLLYCCFNIWTYYHRYIPVALKDGDFSIQVRTTQGERDIEHGAKQ